MAAEHKTILKNMGINWNIAEGFIIRTMEYVNIRVNTLIFIDVMHPVIALPGLRFSAALQNLKDAMRLIIPGMQVITSVEDGTKMFMEHTLVIIHPVIGTIG